MNDTTSGKTHAQGGGGPGWTNRNRDPHEPDDERVHAGRQAAATGDDFRGRTPPPVVGRPRSRTRRTGKHLTQRRARRRDGTHGAGARRRGRSDHRRGARNDTGPRCGYDPTIHTQLDDSHGPPGGASLLGEHSQRRRPNRSVRKARGAAKKSQPSAGRARKWPGRERGTDPQAGTHAGAANQDPKSPTEGTREGLGHQGSEAGGAPTVRAVSRPRRRRLRKPHIFGSRARTREATHANRRRRDSGKGRPSGARGVHSSRRTGRRTGAQEAVTRAPDEYRLAHGVRRRQDRSRPVEKPQTWRPDKSGQPKPQRTRGRGQGPPVAKNAPLRARRSWPARSRGAAQPATMRAGEPGPHQRAKSESAAVPRKRQRYPPRPRRRSV